MDSTKHETDNSAPQAPHTDLKTTHDAIRVLFEPGQVVELRALGSRYTTSGYYNDFSLVATDAIRLGNNPDDDGVYWTLQPLDPALLARAPNQYRERARVTTADQDVGAFRWLLIDLDPNRPSGISSSDAEKKKAYEVAEKVIHFFRELGPDPVFADSGIGYHVLVRIDLPATDAALVQRVLEALDALFSTDEVKIDRKVFNPARISKAYGTIARKGANMPDRPHRLSCLLHVPTTVTVLDRAVLAKIAEEAPKPKTKSKGSKKQTADPAGKMEEFLTTGDVPHGPRLAYRDGSKWLLENCPFDSSHVATSVIVTVSEDGAFGFHCSHNSCADKHWPEFRKHVEEKIGHPFAFTDAPPEPRRPANHPEIITDPTHVDEMVAKSEQVLHAMGLKYFERSGELVSTCHGRDLSTHKNITRAEDSIVIQRASNSTITRDLDTRAAYLGTYKGKLCPVHVPASLPNHIHDRVYSQPRAVPYPTLDIVTASPVLLPSGRVSTPQNVFEEGVFFVPQGWDRFPTVPETPSRDAARQALKQFDQIFSEFPFVDGPNSTTKWDRTASYAVALAGILSLIARPHLGLDAIPLIAASAHAARSGKTKITESISGAALGHKPTAVHYTDEIELGKHLQPLMRGGDRAILFDNIERSFQSAKLCALITGGTLKDRILGLSLDLTLTNYAVLFATGNNLVIGGDLAVRSIRADIDAVMERPESRKFAFDPVTRAIELHPQLVVAALTALRAYLLAGAPWNLHRAAWGGFEKWDRLVCGCLNWLDYGDPYETRDRIIGDDPVRAANSVFLEEWFAKYGSRPVSLRDIQAQPEGEVYAALLKDGRWSGHHARWILRRLNGQVCNGYRLTHVEGRSRYVVVKVNGPGQRDFSTEFESTSEHGAEEAHAF